MKIPLFNGPPPPYKTFKRLPLEVYQKVEGLGNGGGGYKLITECISPSITKLIVKVLNRRASKMGRKGEKK